MDKLTVLVYGGAGTGKTRFAGTFPSPVFIDLDKGMRSLKSAGIAVDYEDYEGVPRQRVFDEVLKSITSLSKDPKYDTIVLDSLTTFAEYAMDSVLFLNKKLGAKPSLPDYGQQAVKIKETITELRRTGKNVILIAHEQLQKDELSGRIWGLPLVTGKLAHNIGVYFDEIYHSEVTQVKGISKYRLVTRPSGLFNARTRLAIPEYIDPDYSELIKNAQKGGPPTN